MAATEEAASSAGSGVDGDGELSIVRAAREEHDANAGRVGAGSDDGAASPDGDSSALDQASLQALEDQAEADRKLSERHNGNRFINMAEKISEFDDQLQRFEDEDDHLAARILYND